MDEYKAVSESKNEVVVELVELIGIENTIKIIKNYGGSFVYIQQMKTIVKEERDANLYSDYLSGMDISNLSKKYNLASSSIRDIINKLRRNQK